MTDLSSSFKVQGGVIGLPVYAFALMFNSNMSPNSAALRDRRLRDTRDLTSQSQM